MNLKGIYTPIKGDYIQEKVLRIVQIKTNKGKYNKYEEGIYTK